MQTDTTQPGTKQTGRVYLVGAGPGDIAFLTVRAQQLLAQADALVYDALVDSGLLQQLSDQCELYFVGKRGGQPSTPQAQINQQLVQLCQVGKRVVRLKAGDPLIFGRAAAEMQALKQAGCPFEVIPGISSALAAPLLANVPLTDPVLSRGFGVFTAHDIDALDWGAIAHLDTTLFLMGSRHLRTICQRLVNHGKPADTPVLIVRWAGQRRQQLWEGDLLTIAQRTDKQSLSPCVIIVGQVVGLRPYLTSPAAPTSPLAGKTILTTRAASQASQFSQMLHGQAANVVEFPALDIRLPSDTGPLDRAIADLAQFDWLILTSPNAVNFFLDRLLAIGKDLRSLSHLKIAVVGKKTARFLQQRGLAADFTPPKFVADSLIEHFPEDPAGQSLLFPRVESGGRAVLVEAMTARGAQVTEVAAYESACPATIPLAAKLAITDGVIDAVTFASSKTVRHFAQLMAQTFGEEWRSHLEGVAIASIGPQTTKDCLEQFGRVTFEASPYNLEGLLAGLEVWAEAQGRGGAGERGGGI